MAQKLLCEGMVNEDVLSNPKVAAAIAGGMEVSSANGFATPDNKYMCLVLLSEPAAESVAETPASETTGSETTTTTETEPAAEGGEGGQSAGGGE